MTFDKPEELPGVRLVGFARLGHVVCVNQQDLEERSQQVNRMAKVYSKAARVVAWLGPSSERTSVAIECFNRIASNVKGDWVQRKPHAVSNDGSWADDRVAPPFSSNKYLAMLELISFEWFECLWRYQEIRLSAVGSLLLRGHYSIQWQSFRSAASFLFQKIRLTGQSENFRNRLEIIFNFYGSMAYMPLGYLLEQTKNCKCPDPRDRIFALLSLMREVEAEPGYGIKPDYTKSHHDVYADAIKHLIAAQRDLRILTSIEMQQSTECTPT
jgi:hypothetical protein